MLIHSAAVEDIIDLEQLVNSAYRGESSRKGWTTEADFLDGIRVDKERLVEIIKGKDSKVLKALDAQNSIVGCVHLEKHGSKLYLGMLTVSPELQNNGIGKLLLAAAEDEAKKLCCNSIYMTVLTERDSLIAWYERHGYVNTKQLQPFPMDNPRFGLPKKHLEFVVLEKFL